MKRYIYSAVSMDHNPLDVQREVASDPNASAWALRDLVKDGSPNMCRLVAENIGTPDELLCELADHKWQDLTNKIISSREASDSVLVHILNGCVDSNPLYRNSVCDQILWEMNWRISSGCKQVGDEVLVLLAELLQTSGCIDLLENDTDGKIRLPYAAFKFIADRHDARLARDLAVDPNTPIDIIEDIVMDGSKWERVEVAQNCEHLTMNCFKMLSQDPDSAVRKYLTWNVTTPVQILRKLVQDEDEKVRRYATKALSARGYILKREEGGR